MKILKDPSKTPWSMKTDCDQCSATLEVEIGDFKRIIHDQRDGDATAFMCPSCGNENWVDLAFIPKHLRFKLPK